ncbi:hypothetical protein V501_07173 [Pseudogymnoascus sp. VKM F-4519 (FW-2642)]|nr:hypothetical protein V501_07173 [Pseudogymnoascus sp. VKM F-4519 (FW-2642)]
MRMRMAFNVYRVQFTMAMQDPDMSSPRYHNVIFVEIEADGSGVVHHVTGDITSGMVYATRREDRPEESEIFVRKEFIGTVESATYPEKINAVLEALPPPPKQKKFNIKTMRTEQMKADGSFYEPGEARPRMVKCTEWTVEQAIPALYASSVLQKEADGDTRQ